MTEITSVLMLMVALELKHLLADYLLQPASWLVNKHRYHSYGGIKHVILHGVLTFIVLQLFGLSLILSVSLSLADAVLHYHIDWYKAHLTLEKSWTPKDKVYWEAFGVDQFLHKLTYVLIVGFVSLR